MKENEFSTDFEHAEGPIVISQGIGQAQWGAFIRQASGSLRRFQPIPMSLTPLDVRVQFSL